MFVRTEWLSERRCLVGTRRVRSPGDPSACAAQWLDVEGGGDEPQRETDRARFIGRGHDQRDPVALAGELSGTVGTVLDPIFSMRRPVRIAPGATVVRSEEHTSEVQSLMRISYAVFCLNTQNLTNRHNKII